MSTVGAVVDRVLQEHIRPATETPAVVFADAAATDSATSIDLDTSNLALDERDAIQPSQILEGPTGELMFVRSVSTSGEIYTVTVARGWQGTTAAALSEDDPVTIAPATNRLAVFNAVADEIVALYPRLWGVTTTAITFSDDYVEVPATTVGVEQVRYLDRTGRPQVAPARLLRDFPDSATNVAITFDALPAATTGQLTYRTAFSRPTAEADTLASLSVQEDWVAVLVLGAAARVVTQLDPRSLSVEFIRDLQQTEGAPPGTSTAVAQRLKRWRDSELEEAARRWREQHPTRVKMVDPLRPWTGAG